MANCAKSNSLVIYLWYIVLTTLPNGERHLHTLGPATTPPRKALKRAGAAAAKQGLQAATNPLKKEGQSHLVLRKSDSPEIVVQERGLWELEELPLDEVPPMKKLLNADAAAVGPS